MAELFAAALEKEGIETELLQIGSMDISGCRGCWACAKTGRCVQDDAAFREAAEKIYEAEGLFIAAPVYYDSMPGQLKSFLDRLFFQDRGGGGLRRKVGGRRASSRRRTGAWRCSMTYTAFMICAGMIGALGGRKHGLSDLEPAKSWPSGRSGHPRRHCGEHGVADEEETTKEMLPPPGLKKRAQTNFIRQGGLCDDGR